MNELQKKAYNKLTVKNANKSTKEELEFAIKQSEIKANHIEQMFDYTTNKTYTILGFQVSSFIGLSAYFFLNNDINGEFDPKLFSVSIMSILFLLSCWYLLKNLRPKTYKYLGGSPFEVLHKDFYGIIDDEKRMKSMLYAELVNYQVQIDFNEDVSKDRKERIPKSIDFMIIIPLIGVGIYLLLATLCS